MVLFSRALEKIRLCGHISKVAPYCCNSKGGLQETLGINLRMDHRLTAATLHLPAVRLPCTTNKLTNNNRLLRAELKSPQVRAALQQDIAAFSLPHSRMSVQEHDRLLSMLFRVMWVRHSGLPQTVPRTPCFTPAVWEQVYGHATMRRQFASLRS